MGAKTKGSSSYSKRGKPGCSWGNCSGPSSCWGLSRVKCTKPSLLVKNVIISQREVSRQRLGTDDKRCSKQKGHRQTTPQRQIIISFYWGQFSLWVSCHYGSLFSHRTSVWWVNAEWWRNWGGDPDRAWYCRVRGIQESEAKRNTVQSGRGSADCSWLLQGNICGSQSSFGGQCQSGEDGEVGQEVQGCSGPQSNNTTS